MQSPTSIWLSKTTIARDVVLAYPNYSKRFEIYADAFKSQQGSIITQNRLTSFLWQKESESFFLSCATLWFDFFSPRDCPFLLRPPCRCGNHRCYGSLQGHHAYHLSQRSQCFLAFLELPPFWPESRVTLALVATSLVPTVVVVVLSLSLCRGWLLSTLLEFQTNNSTSEASVHFGAWVRAHTHDIPTHVSAGCHNDLPSAWLSIPKE